MIINAKIMYNEEYLPTKRHRIPRIREVEETVEVELREIQKEDAKLAFRVTDLGSYLDENGINQFGPVQKEIFAFDNRLFTKAKDMRGALDEGEYPLDQKIQDIETFATQDRYPFPVGAARTKDMVIKELHNFVNKYLVIDGSVYEMCNEPRYKVLTFGLGHNHGGTGMFVNYGYNPNVSKKNYFNALEREEAIQYANHVAARRGDTNDIGTFGKFENIEVFLPELVRCNPQLEHGEGAPFLNSIETLIQESDSTLEAGLLVLTGAADETKKEKPAFAEKIAAANESKELHKNDENHHSNRNDRERDL